MSSDDRRPDDRELAANFLENLLETIAVFSDLKFQERVWIEWESPKSNSISTFIEAVAIFDDNYRWLMEHDFWRHTKLSDQSVESLKSFDALLDRCYSSVEDLTDATRLTDPRWIEVTENAERLLGQLKSTPGIEMPNLWSW